MFFRRKKKPSVVTPQPNIKKQKDVLLQMLDDDHFGVVNHKGIRFVLEYVYKPGRA